MQHGPKPILDEPSDPPGIYRVGTLTYTKLGLVSVFFWMLWGDLCVNFMENVIPQLLPLQLKDLGASATMIGLVSASLPAGVELIVNPFISTYSDRFRSRLGRRRPFMLVCTPILAICLLMVGFAPWMAAKLHEFFGAGSTSSVRITIILIGVLITIFQFFNVVVLATYYYMIADVVPQKVIGAFTSQYKIFGALGGVIFSRYVFPYSKGNEGLIYGGAALLYVLAFMMMCWRVKEGEYPPPPKLAEKGDPIEAGIQWVRESFSIRFYQKLYMIGLFYYFLNASLTFRNIFAIDDLKMSRAAVGDANAQAGLWSLPVFFVMGLLADKFHPLRTGIVGMFLMSASALGSYYYIHDAASFKLWTILNQVTTTVWLGSQISMLPRLFPRSQYGQYCSANNTLCAIGKFGAPVLCGMLIGAMKDNNRLNFLWAAASGGLGIVAVVVVYLHWKRLGGDLRYTPPEYAGANTRGFPTEPALAQAIPQAIIDQPIPGGSSLQPMEEATEPPPTPKE